MRSNRPSIEHGDLNRAEYRHQENSRGKVNNREIDGEHTRQVNFIKNVHFIAYFNFFKKDIQ